MHYYLGIDCGGTFIKGAIYDEKGKLKAHHREALQVLNPSPYLAERDLHQLWASAKKVIHHLFAKSLIKGDEIKGIGITAQGKGAYLLDKNHHPLGQGILSSDKRALKRVKAWQEEGIADKAYALSRQTLWTGHPVSILRAIKDQDPNRYQQIGAVLMAHDYLRFCLTGSLFVEETNISESNLYNMHTGKLDSALFQLFGIEEIEDALPEIVKSQQIAGYVSRKVAQETGLAQGTPVVGGLFDVVANAYSVNLAKDNALNISLGTWSVVSGLTQDLKDTSYPYVYGRFCTEDTYIVHEASPTSSANLEWFLSQWQSISYADINASVKALPVGESGLFFIPFLYGSNQGSHMQGGFYGLQAHHSRYHLLQAVYEGVLFSLMLHLERMKKRFPETEHLIVSGGATKSRPWMQMLADLSGLPIALPKGDASGCFGAAQMAMPQEIRQQMPKLHLSPLTPQLASGKKLNQKYQQYQKLIQCLQQFHQR